MKWEALHERLYESFGQDGQVGKKLLQLMG